MDGAKTIPSDIWAGTRKEHGTRRINSRSVSPCVYRVSPSGKLASSHEFTHRITFTVEHSARDLYLINPLASGVALSPFYCAGRWLAVAQHKQQPSPGTRIRRIRLRMCVTCRIDLWTEFCRKRKYRSAVRWVLDRIGDICG